MKSLFFIFQSAISSNKHIVGSLLALLGLCGYFSGQLTENWLVITIGLYILGYRITPAENNDHDAYEGFLGTRELIIEFNRLIRLNKSSLPKSILVLLQDIKQELNIVLKNYDSLSYDPQTKHVIQQIIIEYLPNILDTYRRLPHVSKSQSMGTSVDLVASQLELLNEQLKKTNKILREKNMSKLRAHNRFLQTKFSTSKP